jgi:anti-anti-sigma factor
MGLVGSIAGARQTLNIEVRPFGATPRPPGTSESNRTEAPEVPVIKSEIQDGLLTVRQTVVDDRLCVAIEGELDLASVETAENALLSALATGQKVLVDLRELIFIDSTGISLLVMAMRMKETGLKFVPSLSTEVQRLFSLTGLDERMQFASAEEAPSPPDEDLPEVLPAA